MHTLCGGDSLKTSLPLADGPGMAPALFGRAARWACGCSFGGGRCGCTEELAADWRRGCCAAGCGGFVSDNTLVGFGRERWVEANRSSAAASVCGLERAVAASGPAAPPLVSSRWLCPDGRYGAASRCWPGGETGGTPVAVPRPGSCLAHRAAGVARSVAASVAGGAPEAARSRSSRRSSSSRWISASRSRRLCACARSGCAASAIFRVYRFCVGRTGLPKVVFFVRGVTRGVIKAL